MSRIRLYKQLTSRNTNDDDDDDDDNDDDDNYRKQSYWALHTYFGKC